MDAIKYIFEKILTPSKERRFSFYFIIAFISTFFINTSLGVNILNSANTGSNISSFNYILMTISFFMMFLLMIEGFLITFHKSPPLAYSMIGAGILTLLFFLLINPIASIMVSSRVEDTGAKNVANIYATKQYYNLNKDERKSVVSIYQLKKDLLDDIIYIENKENLIKDKSNLETAGNNPSKDFMNYSFWNILGILVYTDKDLIKMYESKIDERHSLRLERELKEKTEQLHDDYSLAYKTAKVDFNNQQIQYNKQIQVFNNINNLINKDYLFIDKFYEKEQINTNNKISQINANADLWAQAFVSKNKDGIIYYLEKIKRKKKCEHKCVQNSIKKYDKKYGQYAPYTYWLVMQEKSGLTQTLEEGTKFIASNGLSSLYQFRSGYLEQNKMASYINYDNQHFIALAKNLYLVNQSMQSELITYTKNPNTNVIKLAPKPILELKSLNSLKNNLIVAFKKEKGYSITGNDITQKSQFIETSKRYYANIYKLKMNKPVFEDLIKNEKYQSIAQKALGQYYIKNIPLSYTNKELADKILEPQFKNNIIQMENNIDDKEAFKKVIYPYIVLFFVTLFFIISSISIISKIISLMLCKFIDITIVSNTIITFVLTFIVTIYIYNYDLSKSTDITSAKEVVQKLNQRAPMDEFMINTIMFTYPIMIKTEEIKAMLYLDVLTNSYSVLDKAKKIDRR